jgi:hypothetical protein
VLCTVSKRQKGKMQDNEKKEPSTEEVLSTTEHNKKNPAGVMDVCVVCFAVRTKGKIQDNPKSQVQIKYRVQENTKKNPDGAIEIFH